MPRSCPRPLCRLAPRRKARPVGRRQGRIEHGGEVAAVIFQPRGGCVGHGVRRNQVVSAQRHRVAPGLARRRVDQPLHEIVAFGAAGAAIGADRHGVGQHRLDGDADQRRAVQAGRVLDQVHGRDRRAETVAMGADIGAAGETNGEEAAVGVERQLARDHRVPAVVVRHKALAAVIAPPDRSTERPRRMQQGHVLRIGRRLHPERAADVAGQHLQGRRCDAEDPGQRLAQAEDALAADVQRQPRGCAIVGGDGGAWLHRRGVDAVVDEAQPRHMSRPGEGLFDRHGVAEPPIEDDVVRDLGEQARRPRGGGRSGIGDHRQSLDLQLDPFRPVPGRRQALRDHERDGLADKAHAVRGQRRSRRRLDRAAVVVLQGQLAAQRADAGGGQIGGRVDRNDPRYPQRRRDIQATDQPMCVVRPQHVADGLAGQSHIVGEATGTGQQAPIFRPGDGLADGLLAPVVHGRAQPM